MLRRIGLPAALLLLLSGCAGLGRPSAPPPAPTVDPPPIWAEPAFPPAPPPHPEPEPPPPPPPPPKPTYTEHRLSDTLKLQVELPRGIMPNVKRTVRLVRLEDGVWQNAGEVTITGLPLANSIEFARQDLPGHPGAVVITAKRDRGIRKGAVAVVDGKLVALDYARLIAPKPEVTDGTFMYLNKYLNQLWVYRDGALIATFPTANGRDPWGTQPTWQDYKTNYKTPEGLFRIASKIVNPPYKGFGNHPPAEGGAPNNPLGTRWMGVEVLSGDGGGIWGFHGTYVPEQLGTWASEGCIRLATPDAEKLYDLISVGTKVRIVAGK